MWTTCILKYFRKSKIFYNLRKFSIFTFYFVLFRDVSQPKRILNIKASLNAILNFPKTKALNEFCRISLTFPVISRNTVTMQKWPIYTDFHNVTGKNYECTPQFITSLELSVCPIANMTCSLMSGGFSFKILKEALQIIVTI